MIEMADQVSVRLTAEAAEGRTDPEGVSFARWLEAWREQFRHWHDPMRELVFQQVRGKQAEYLIAHLARTDGFAFADFVLSCVAVEEHRISFAARLRDEPRPPRFLPTKVADAIHDHRPAMSRAVAYLFARFAHHAPFCTGPAPADPISWADVSDIYPKPSLTAEPHEAREETLP
jgi:hypothetical protein